MFFILGVLLFVLLNQICFRKFKKKKVFGVNYDQFPTHEKKDFDVMSEA